jgi:mRNA-degrading endonuclease toxin of MazEF toxin-antitoxin module
MKTTHTIDLPVLKDVVVLGKDVPSNNELPPVLNELQAKALEQQIEQIIQKRLEVVLKKATAQAMNDIKAHLDKMLPELIQANQKYNGLTE